jgi:hypothetical protein
MVSGSSIVRSVILVNCSGTCTMTVPVLSAEVGVASVVVLVNEPLSSEGSTVAVAVSLATLILK